MIREKITQTQSIIEEYRGLAARFIRGLDCSHVEYVTASRHSGGEVVYLTIRCVATEVGGPRSNAISDVDKFEKAFREEHARAFSLLPSNVAIVLELLPTPDATHALTLYP